MSTLDDWGICRKLTAVRALWENPTLTRLTPLFHLIHRSITQHFVRVGIEIPLYVLAELITFDTWLMELGHQPAFQQYYMKRQTA
jgi:hypothetical protein